ncbi:hypothetical protein LTR08_007000 [Meristemomyces frigidus]|nr:hypothetical protein LTR08_007000 [Meristemomyces frigidus]
MPDTKRGDKKQYPKAPYPVKPYDGYHALNKNKVNCLVTESFVYWVAPHVGRKEGQMNCNKLQSRVEAIPHQVANCRNPELEYIDEDGVTQKCGQNLPEMIVHRA